MAEKKEKTKNLNEKLQDSGYLNIGQALDSLRRLKRDFKDMPQKEINEQFDIVQHQIKSGRDKIKLGK